MRAIMPFVQEEFDKIQQALSRSYAERDKYAGEMDKLREELERVQVKPKKDTFFASFLFTSCHSGRGRQVPDCSREDPAGAGQGPPGDRHPAREDGAEHRRESQGEFQPAKTLD